MTKEQYKYFPQTKDELRSLIQQRVKVEGNNVNLNDIDVSAITDMSRLFQDISFNSSNFNGNISAWDVSNVTNMTRMFCWCKELKSVGDISYWDVSKVNSMIHMFFDCKKFNQDISNWDVSNVMGRVGMFYGCPIKNEYEPKFKQIIYLSKIYNGV